MQLSVYGGTVVNRENYRSIKEIASTRLKSCFSKILASGANATKLSFADFCNEMNCQTPHNCVVKFCEFHHHHLSVMELGHLLTRSGLMYPEVSSKVCHGFFCQLGNSVSLSWVIYY
jgi:hypothetical protein